MFEFKIAKDEKKSRKVHKMGGADLQCMNNHYRKSEYNGMKTVSVTDYTNQTPKAFWMEKNLSSTPVKIRKY